MSRADDGGAAFPGEKRVLRMGYESKETEPVPGMSLRDYFAAKAMQGLLSSGRDPQWAANTMRELSVSSYEIADAMLEARKK